MNSNVQLTTSWDDGHPSDLRVAELLAKYGIPGTFYVPMHADNETMTPAQVRDLAGSFEIGAHTLHHTILTHANDSLAAQEIKAGRAWLQDITGRSCTMFCPPQGKFTGRHVRLTREAGYVGLRTVELLSWRLPYVRDGVCIMPTSCQAFPHGAAAYIRNAARRVAMAGFWCYVQHGAPSDWILVAQTLLEAAARRGGAFHLWGHSWELSEHDQWRRLEQVLQIMRTVASRGATTATNGQICADAMRNRGLRKGVTMPASGLA